MKRYTVYTLGPNGPRSDTKVRSFWRREDAKGFSVTEETFYGGVFSNGEPDSLFGVWTR